MIPLTLQETQTTPYINLDAKMGILTFEGRSIPENVIDFYHPILAWLDEYSKNPNDITTVNLKFEYFNTSSSKRIFDIMKKVDLIPENPGKKVIINWFYEGDDEDIFFAGNDYKALISKAEFNLVEL